MIEPAPTTRTRRPLAGTGRVLVWPGASLWVGHDVAAVPPHAHHAIQVSLTLDRAFRIRCLAWEGWREVTGVVLMPDVAHALDGRGATLASLFVEPNSRMGAALRARFAGADAQVLAADEAEGAAALLRPQVLRGADDELLVGHGKAAICRLAGDPALAPAIDPRISAAIAWMRARLASPLRLDGVARAVHLSPGRFRHLFAAQTGTSFRAWLLWARAEHAIGIAARGGSWTQAAQAAGFADAAHFTRSCRRIFGIAPTMLGFESPAANR
jgi:AraC family transcriptional regulator